MFGYIFINKLRHTIKTTTTTTKESKTRSKQLKKKIIINNYFSCFVFQVQLLLDIENSLPLFILKRFQVHSYSEYPNSPKSIKTKVSYKSFLMIAFRGSKIEILQFYVSVKVEKEQ